MSAETLLTRDDLEELSDTAYEAADPAEVAVEMVAAAEGGRLADQDDVGYAYLLAAEIYERADELERALATAEQALAVHRTSGDRSTGSIRALRAELLLRSGRDGEGTAELEQLRPLMTTSGLAASYVPEALAAGGYPETALQWLTDALAELRAAPSDDAVVAQLIAARDRLREAPAGEEDQPLVDVGKLDVGKLDVGESDVGESDGDAGRSEAVLLVWPYEEYEEVDDRWPEVLEATGADDWDGYRRRQQVLIAEWAERGRAPLWQVTGTAEGFAEFLAEQGADPASADLVGLAGEYGDYLAEQESLEPLPPRPGGPCWCRSGVPYEKCCLPLASHRR